MAILTGGFSHAKIIGVTVGASAVSLRTGVDILTLDKIEQTQVQYAEGSLTFTQLDDSAALYTFLDKYQSAGGQEPVRVKLENGDEVVVGSSDQEYVVGVSLGPKDGTTRKVTAVYGIITGSGNTTQQNGEIGKPTFQITGAGAPFDVTVDVGGFGGPTGISGTGKTVTIKKGKKSVVSYVTV